jgi:signal transduction histidine kinase
VLANFLSNAVKFSPEGSPVTVSVSFTPAETAAERRRRKVRAARRAAARRGETVVTITPPDAGGASGDAKSGLPAAPAKAIALDDVELDEVSSVPLAVGNSAWHWRPPSHLRVRVSVVDRGRGLSLYEQQRLFQPYSQLTSGEQQQGKGTGLGLSISKSLVELHGGVIGVSSTGIAGQGCEFFFELPMEVVPSNQSSASASPQLFHVPNLNGAAAMRAWHTVRTL